MNYKFYNQKPWLGMQINKVHPLAKGLVGCWLFNEGTGDKVFDLSGNGNNGTLINMNPADDWVIGRDGWALDFNGNGEYIDLDNVLNFTSNGFSLLTWFNRTGNSIVGVSGTLIGKEDLSNAQYTLEVKDSDQVDPNKIRVETFGLADHSIISATSIVNNQRYQVVFTWDGVLKKIYLNGKLDAQESTSGNMSANSDSLKIGFSQGSEAGQNYFNGLIMQALIYNRALSASEALQLYINPYQMFEYGFNPAFIVAPVAVGNPWYAYAQQ